MRDKELYRQILGIEAPWTVRDVTLRLAEGEVIVHVEHTGKGLRCPECDRESSCYDHRERRWRHLDTCQYRTVIVARVPRVACPEHGVLQIRVPWSESHSRFTALFEALVIDWLREASESAVSRLLRLSWDEVDGVMERAVRRGLLRREDQSATRIGVDETSFRKRHDYVTVVTDQDSGDVLHVGDGRDERALRGYYEGLTGQQLKAIEAVSMDMWKAYIKATRASVPDADTKIAFDRFHVSRHLNEAVDKIRRQEHKALRGEGCDDLKNTKYWWLMNPKNMDENLWNDFETLRESKLKTARAWSIKELAATLWGYVTRGWARKAWKKWLSWAMRCRLEPIKAAACMIRDHLWGILNAIALKATNARAESINAKIQKIKAQACGYRNRERFRNAIYFHLGGLDLYPASITHTNL